MSGDDNAKTLPGEAPRVSSDAPCRACGYNLRELIVSGNCPECGAPIELSLRSDRLEDANPAWVRKLGTGTMFLIPATLINEVFFLAVRFSLITPPAWVMRLLSALYILLIVCAMWLLSEREPGKSIRTDHWSRRPLRLFAICLTSEFLVSSTLQILHLSFPICASASVTFQGLIRLGQIYLLFLFLGYLAGRLPDRESENAAKALRIAYFPLILVYETINSYAAWMFLVRPAGPAFVSQIPIRVYSIVTGLAFLLEPIVLFVLVRMTRNLALAYRTARCRWVASTA